MQKCVESDFVCLPKANSTCLFRYGVVDKPMYINVVRDPIERLVSYYYFLRFGDDYRPGLRRRKQGDKKVFISSSSVFWFLCTHMCDSWLGFIFQTFDECVASGGSDCAPEKLWLQIPFFCGHHSECWWVCHHWEVPDLKLQLLMPTLPTKRLDHQHFYSQV